MIYITMSGEKHELRKMANFLVRHVFFEELEFIQPPFGDMRLVGLASGVMPKKIRKRAKHCSVDRCGVYYEE